MSIKKLAGRTDLSRNTIRRALRSDQPPVYRRAPAGSMLDPFKEEIHRLLKDDPTLSGVLIREKLEPLGFAGGKTIVDDYVREVRPFYLPPRTYQRTVYRPGEICQWDLWQPSREIPVGHSQSRMGYVVICALGYSRVGAGALIFSKEAVDILWGMTRCLRVFGAVPRSLVWDREGAMHAGDGRPTLELAGFCGQLRCGWRILDPGDCEAKGVVEWLQGYAETNFEPGRSFANHLDFQFQLDRWFEKANARNHRGLRCRPIDRLADDVAAMIAAPTSWPESDRRRVMRVPVDPYVRFDTNDYSLDPRLAGRRVEVRVSQTDLTAVALDTGELVAPLLAPRAVAPPDPGLPNRQSSPSPRPERGVNFRAALTIDTKTADAVEHCEPCLFRISSAIASEATKPPRSAFQHRVIALHEPLEGSFFPVA